MKHTNLLNKLKYFSEAGDKTINEIISINLLNNIQRIDEVNINELSQLSNCSKASIVKFCKILNLNGFKELIRILSFESKFTYFTKKDSTNTTLIEYKNNILENIENALTFCYEQIQEIVKEIKICKQIYLFGKGPNLNVCNIFHNYLIKLGFNTIFSTDLDVQEKVARNISDTSLVFFFSFSAMTSQLVSIYDSIKDKGCKIVVLTGNPKGIIVKESNINIYTINNEEILNGQRNSVISFVTIVMAIINLLNN